MRQIEHLPEYWFDSRDGSLLVGRDAAMSRIDEAGPDIVNLRELLVAEDFPFSVTDYEKVPLDNWTKEDYVDLGVWALKLVQNDESDRIQALNHRHVRRLYLLGLGPDHRTIAREKRFGTFADFQREIGSPINKPNGYFDSWSLSDYIEYAARLASKLGRKPTMQDYDEEAAADLGQYTPNYQVIQDRVGGIGKLHEHLGYPNPTDWNEDDFIDWGVKVIRANPHRNFTTELIGLLSTKDRGPAAKTIIDRFKKWSNFSARVHDKLTNVLQQEINGQLARLETAKHLVSEGMMPARIVGLPMQEVLAFTARYLVIAKCLPDIGLVQHQKIAKKYSEQLIPAIRKLRPDLSAGFIETTAVSIGVYDDIWPMDDYREHYRVA